MARFVRRRKMTRPFRAMRKARMYRSAGLASYGRSVGRYMMNKAKNQIHWFRKEIALDPVYESGSNINGLQFLQVSTIPDWSDLSDNYDEYLVKKIIYTFEPQFSGSNTNTVAPYQRWMRVVHDYNDANLLSTESQYLDYSNCKSYLCTRSKPIRVTLYPRILQSVSTYPSGVVSAKSVKPGWLSTETGSNVQMFGIKYFIPTLGMTPGYGIFRIRATVILGFKNIR